MFQLPPLSEHIRVLRQDESERLDALDASLPKSLKQCITCGGKLEFKWINNYGGLDPEVGMFACNCAEQFTLFKFLLNAGIPLRYQRFALGDLTDVDAEAQLAAFDYIDNHDYYLNQGRGFVFQGDPGTGKTLLATLLLKRMLDEGVDGYFTTFTDMLDTFASGWRDDKQKAWFDKRVRNAPLLVIDDIGKEHPNRTNSASVAIDNIVRSRVQNGKPTVITTNLTPDQLRRTYGSAMEMLSGSSLNYRFAGASWRTSKEAERNRYEASLKLTRPIVIS